MKQVLQNYKTGELKVHDVPAPEVMAGFLLVANRASLISAGTERSTMSMAKKNLAGKAMARPDLVGKVIDKVKKDGIVETLKMVNGRLDALAALGYSSAGEVIAVGEGVKDFAVGDRVACAGQDYASHAEIIQVPVNLCLQIPVLVSFDDASYVAVGAIALQGVRQAEPKLGETVAVIGLGLLGLILVQMLKANGCKVIATDLDSKKLELAKEFGVDRAVLPAEFLGACHAETHDQGVDVAIIVASTKSDEPITNAAEVCRKKGRVVVVGAVGMNLPREPYYVKELDLRLSTSYGPGRYDSNYEEMGRDYPYAYVRWTEGRNMQAFLGLVDAGSINLQKITTHKFDIDDAESAYKLISENTDPYLGIVLHYDLVAENITRKVEVTTQPFNAKEQLGVSIIGAGNHVKDMLIPHLTLSNGYALQGICSQRGISAKQLAEKIHARFASSSVGEVLSDKDTDAVIIGTRHDTHAQIILDSLQAGKNVFVEKPLALSKDELNKIEAFYLSDISVVKPVLMVGFNRRYSQHSMKIKEFFDKRHSALVLNYRINAGAIAADHWIQDAAIGGGRIIGEACHFIDLMQYLTGARVVHVYASSVGHHPSGITNDHSIINLKFSDGSIGSLVYAAGGCNGIDKEHLEVIGDGKVVVMKDFYETSFYDGNKKSIFKSRKRDKGFENEMKTFARLIKNNDWQFSQFEDDKATTLASFAAQESLSTGLGCSIS